MTVYNLTDYFEKRKREAKAEKVVDAYALAIVSLYNENFEKASGAIGDMIEMVPELGAVIWKEFYEMCEGKDVPKKYAEDFCRLGARVAGNMKNYFIDYGGRFMGKEQDFIALSCHLDMLEELAEECKDENTRKYVISVRELMGYSSDPLDEIIKQSIES